jgi:hypothetical protein
MSRSKNREYDDFEDVSKGVKDDINGQIKDGIEDMTSDMTIDIIPEEDYGGDDLPPPEEKKSKRKKSPAKPAIKSVVSRSKGKRTVTIHELDPEIIPPSVEKFMDPECDGSKIVMVGKPGTGKSRMLKSILYEKSEIFPVGQAASGTEDANGAYSKLFPKTFIFNAFSQAVHHNFINRQKIAKKYLTNPWAVTVWDDISEDERIFNLPIVKGTYKNGRHWKMLHILSTQYALDMKPVIRGAIDGSFLLREPNKKVRKSLFENYASSINDFGDFCDIMDQVTNDYTALFINNRTQSNNFEDCVYYYKARDNIPDSFRVGCQEFWLSSIERYDEKYSEPIYGA